MPTLRIHSSDYVFTVGNYNIIHEAAIPKPIITFVVRYLRAGFVTVTSLWGYNNEHFRHMSTSQTDIRTYIHSLRLPPHTERS